MYTRILIPLDGSSLSEQVLPYGRFLARALGSPVQLLKVIDRNEFQLTAKPSQGGCFDAILPRSIASSRAYLKKIARSFQEGQVSCSVHEGNPTEVLMEKAKAEKNTLIVMATHGGSGIRRWLLGSVANKLLQEAANDIFLIPVTGEGSTGGEAILRRVIIPLDGSRFAEKVLPRIEELTETIGLKLVLLQVSVRQPADTKHPYSPHMSERFNQLGGGLHQYLGKKVRELKRKGLVDVESMVEFGYAADQIICTAEKTRDSFVAMCTHGGSGMNRWVLGSVTNAVVRHSRGPVLVIRDTTRWSSRSKAALNQRRQGVIKPTDKVGPP